MPTTSRGNRQSEKANLIADLHNDTFMGVYVGMLIPGVDYE